MGTNDGFDVNDWLDEEAGGGDTASLGGTLPGYTRQRTQEVGQSPDQLVAAMSTARSGRDHERVIHLGQALLSLAPEAVTNDVRLTMDASARAMVDSFDPSRIDQAIVWANIWGSFNQSNEVKSCQKDLRQRLTKLSEREKQVRDCMSNGPLSALLMAVHELASSKDRQESTAATIQQGQQTLEAREHRLQQAHQQLEQLIPVDIAQACRVMTDIFNEEPDRTNQERLASLHARAEQTKQLMAYGQAAVASRNYQDLQAAAQRLGSHGDRVPGYDDLLAHLRGAHDELSASIADRRDDFQNFLAQKDLERAIRALQDLGDLEPGAPEIAQLPKLIEQHRSWMQLAEQMEEAIEARHEAAITAAINPLKRSKHPQAKTLIQDAETALAEIRQQRRRQARRGLLVIIAVLIVIAVPIGIHFHNSYAFQQANSAGDAEDRIAALEQYIDDPIHLLYKKDAERMIAGIRDQQARTALQTALATEDGQARIDALQAYIAEADPTAASRYIAEAEQQLAATRKNLDYAHFAAARGHKDLHDRVTALKSYLNESQGRFYVDDAEALIAKAETRIDDEAWEAANADAPLDQRIANLKAYLAADTKQDYADMARNRLSALEQQAAHLAAKASDQEAWEAVLAVDNPQDQLTAIDTYLARSGNKRHEHRAKQRRELVLRELDDANWQRVVDNADEPERQLALARSYLEGNSKLAHKTEAEHLVEQLLRRIDDIAWKQASQPGPARERIQRLENYLASDHKQFRDSDAKSLILAAKEEMDLQLFDKAHTIKDPIARLLALDAYLALDQQKWKTAEAERLREDSIAAVAALPDQRLQVAPLEVLAALPAKRLASLPPTLLIQLPVKQLRKLPAKAFHRFKDSHVQQLPIEIRARAERRPSWASDTGVDQHGPWAVLSIDRRRQVRFRFLFPGQLTVSLPSGDVTATVQHGVWLMQHEMLQDHWEDVLSSRANPSQHRGDELPVHGLSLSDCDDFLTELADDLDEFPTLATCRLPTPDELFLAAFHSGPGSDYPVASLSTWQATVSQQAPQIALGPSGKGGFQHLLDNVAELARNEAGKGLVCLGPFGQAVDGFTLDTPAETNHALAGMRLVIPAETDETFFTATAP